MNAAPSRPPLTFISPPVISIRSFRTKFRLRILNSKPYSNRFRISTTRISLSNVTTPPTISAHFDGEIQTRIRRNYLREKILEKQQVERNSSNNLVDYSEKRFEVSESITYGNVVAEAIGHLPVEESLKLVGESVLLSKLESWADQYKKDVGLWGVGSSPIFTVFEDLDGNVERVLVDEDEIRARRGLDEDLKEVNLRILHARLLAKESDSRNSVIARNSTVAKFVVLGEGRRNGLDGVKIAGENSDKIVEVKELDDVNVNVKSKNSEFVEPMEESGFVSAVKTVVSQPGLYAKFSKFGFVAFSGFLVLWAVKSVIADRYRDKLTTLEKGKTEEKIKSEKDETPKVSVEVVEVSSQAQKVHIRRPELDKQELLKKMCKDKAPSTSNFQLQQSPSSQGTEDRNLEETLSDIRDISKHDKDVKANSSVHYDAIQTCSPSVVVVQNGSKTMTGDDLCKKEQDEVIAPVQDKESCVVMPLVRDEAYQDTNPSSIVKPVPEQSAPRKKVRIIKSVQEARDYLFKKRGKQEPLHKREDLLPKGVSASCPQSETGITGIKIDEADDSKVDLSENISALPVAIRSKGMMGDSQPHKDFDDGNNNDIGQNENSAMSKKHHNFGTGSPTVMENQHSHQDYVGIFNESTLVPYPQPGTDNYCSRNGDVENHTGFSPDNVAPILGSSDSNEEMESQPIEGGHTDSNNDIGKAHQSLVSPKYMDHEDSSSAAFVKIEPPQDHEIVISLGGAFSDLQSEDDGMPTQILDGDPSQKKKETGPAKDRKHAATSGFDNLLENFATSETNQTPEQNSVTEPPEPNNDNWLEKNFHVLDPVVATIRDGFRENYKVAQEKTEEGGTISDLSQLKSIEDDHELEWMKDDHLRDIVFKVRDNELSGREPFHMMSNEDRAAFFDGLQKKVEQENKSLLKVHEYVHSNVENLNYGADGISIYDPPDKVIPRWKGPPMEKAPEFLSKPVEQKGAMVNGNVRSPLSEKSHATSPLKVENGAPKKPKTIIEGSDGSVKPGKKNGKEFWQHTKKWSRGFLELYNAETDPEMKATMKDIGKDLDRWITEEEIQEAAELIEKMPEKNKAFIQKKVEKIKREMELFGPQAVVSKYREYSEEKEEDYLWWLDLPYVLCIEMYTNEGGEQIVGFYSLEMATDLELEPKPCHVIAFEDSKDCKNMCYIIQAHLEMLGSGLAFVVARPPKDTFRESKANGFNVTVIRKGELSLNIDQTLEEVEEQIVEIGSKMYHDQIMKDRSVDMNGLMKGVIGETKPIRGKRTRRKLKNFPANRNDEAAGGGNEDGEEAGRSNDISKREKDMLKRMQN
ncbi:unnamed protein product [Rhodiola kirilowii]